MQPLTIHPLTPERAEDYLGYFDEDAFADHVEWSWCYCTFFHESDEDMPEDFESITKAGVRAKAAQLVQDGTLTGYLAYRNGRVVGWCNAGDKTGYKRLRADTELWPDEQKTLAVVCFVIEAGQRRGGVATQLLQRALADAAAAGYQAAEAYPAVEGNCYENFHGYAAMYAAAGFAVAKTLPERLVMRKAL